MLDVDSGEGMKWIFENRCRFVFDIQSLAARNLWGLPSKPTFGSLLAFSCSSSSDFSPWRVCDNSLCPLYKTDWLIRTISDRKEQKFIFVSYSDHFWQKREKNKRGVVDFSQDDTSSSCIIIMRFIICTCSTGVWILRSSIETVKFLRSYCLIRQKGEFPFCFGEIYQSQ